MKRALALAAVLAVSAAPGWAQTFSSGSTGADGPLDLTSGDLRLQLPPDGVFNFTTINIPTGRTLTFDLNANNTPVYLLAQGNVTIAGTIDVSARNEAPNFRRTPGPGGFHGSLPGGNGFGPGGGTNGGPQVNGRWVGPLSLVPIVGGSGSGSSPYYGAAGGGGGGAVVVASSGSVLVGGMIIARGQPDGFGYSGSGGAIRLVANSITVSGELNATGYSNNHGVIRIEAPRDNLTFTGTSSPAAVLSEINPAVLPPSGFPSLTITSLGGFSVPPNSGTRSDTVDLLLPTQTADPIPLTVEARNIPVGSEVTLSISGSPGTFTPGTLTGTNELSTATLQISGLDRTKVVFLWVSITFDVPTMGQVGNADGQERIARLRVTTSPGAESELEFLRADGTAVALDQVPATLRQLYGR